MAVDSAHVYWADSGQVGDVNGTINSAPLGDGLQTATTLVGDLDIPVGVVVHGGLIYWASAAEGSISAMPVTGGGPVSTVFSNLSTPMALALGP